jgi:hypothetical protein
MYEISQQIRADSPDFWQGVEQPLCAAETPTLFREPACRGFSTPLPAPDVALGRMTLAAEAWPGLRGYAPRSTGTEWNLLAEG